MTTTEKDIHLMATNSLSLPKMLKNEIERVSDDLSDVATPAIIELLAADGLRELKPWEGAIGASDTPAAIMADRLFSSELFRLGMTISTLAASSECQERAAKRMIDAFLVIDGIEKDFPECAERIQCLASDLLSASYDVAKSLTLAEHERQNSTMRPLVKVNAAKADAIKRACAIAADRWQSDTTQSIRLGEMADKIYRALVDEGFAEVLPGNTERIKEWIKPVAPAYARQGGAPKGARRPKTS